MDEEQELNVEEGAIPQEGEEARQEAQAPEEEPLSEEEWEEVESEVIERFRKFARRASEWHHDLYERIKDDRAFESGEQWTRNDRANRGEGRAEACINLCSVYVNAIVNPFQAKPFKFKALPRDQRFMQAAVALNASLTKFQNEFGMNEANSQAFRDAVMGGLGFTYATVEERDGEKEVRYYAVSDPTMVIVDPDARGAALEEAEEVAVVDFTPYEKAKEDFGEGLVSLESPGSARLADFGQDWEVPKDHLAVVTYFVRDGHDVVYYRLCGDHIVDYGRFEGLSRLPVFAFIGDRIWVKDKLSYGGVVRKIKAQQRTINYAQSQLLERMAKSPKGFFLSSVGSLEGFEEEYQNAEYGLNYILHYNASDSNGNACSPPQFINPQTHVEDLQGVINTSVQQMSLAVGISPSGIVSQDLREQSTATEVLLRTRSNQSNVSNYINHARESIRIAGEALAHLTIMAEGIDLPKGSYDIVVEEGCVSLTKMEEDREKLLALAQIVPEQFKLLVTQQIVSKLDIEGSEKIAQVMWNTLPQQLRGGVPGWNEIQQMQRQMQQLQAQLQQAQAENETLNNQLTQMQLRTQTDLSMQKLRHAQNLQMKAIDIAEKAGEKALAAQQEAEEEAKGEEKELKKRMLDAVDEERAMQSRKSEREHEAALRIAEEEASREGEEG